jgi:tRNA threonylcarbamoyl adenosine modification protein (Sua5/YciO/YrdC/YwlC family)
LIHSLDPKNPDPAVIRECAELLRAGEIIVCPTDTVYAFVCSCTNARGIERLAKLKGVRLNKANLSLLCSDLSDLSRYAKQVSTPSFRIMKQALPGPYTFILQASNMIPSLFKNKKRTVGIRVPDDRICSALVEELGVALAATSVHTDENDTVQVHLSDPTDILSIKGHLVAAILDGGARGLTGSTVVDLSGDEPTVIREGKGSLDIL